MTPPTDFDVREVARTTFDTTVVVEAGAVLLVRLLHLGDEVVVV